MNGKRAKHLRRTAVVLWNQSNPEVRDHFKSIRRLYRSLKRRYTHSQERKG